jgi:hypothetical protein
VIRRAGVMFIYTPWSKRKRGPTLHLFFFFFVQQLSIAAGFSLFALGFGGEVQAEKLGDEMGHRMFSPLGFLLLAIVVLYGGELLIPRIHQTLSCSSHVLGQDQV